MWNRVTQPNIDSFKDLISITMLCKLRRTGERQEGNRQAYDHCRAGRTKPKNVRHVPYL